MMTLALRRAAVAMAATGMLLVAACNADDEGPTPTPPAPGVTPTPPVEEPTPPAEDQDAEEATTVTAALVDFDIELSDETFTAGTYTFVVEQQGGMPHSLAIEGPGVNEETAIIEPGGPDEELTVTLEPGTYVLWCPVGNHRAMGMEITMEVT